MVTQVDQEGLLPKYKNFIQISLCKKKAVEKLTDKLKTSTPGQSRIIKRKINEILSVAKSS